jgi:hypothetical protein
MRQNVYDVALEGVAAEGVSGNGNVRGWSPGVLWKRMEIEMRLLTGKLAEFWKAA